MTRQSLSAIFPFPSKIIPIVILIIGFIFGSFLLSCSKSNQNAKPGSTPEIKVEFPTPQELNALNGANSISAGDAFSLPGPIRIDKEPNCDGEDDDGDKLVDEECFGCFPNMKTCDFDNDGVVTMLDCGVPILIANAVTTMKNSSSCADVNKNGTIGMDDTLACLDIFNAGGGK
jgi:hypothetical protein